MIENTERHNLKVYKLYVYNWNIWRKVEISAEAISEELLSKIFLTLDAKYQATCVFIA